jgi:hypothetical protein
LAGFHFPVLRVIDLNSFSLWLAQHTSRTSSPVLRDSNLNSNATFPIFFRFLLYRLLTTSSNSILRNFTDIFQLPRHFFLSCESQVYLKIHLSTLQVSLRSVALLKINPSHLQISHRSVVPLIQVRGSAFPASHSSPSPSASLKRQQPQL